MVSEPSQKQLLWLRARVDTLYYWSFLVASYLLRQWRHSSFANTQVLIRCWGNVGQPSTTLAQLWFSFSCLSCTHSCPCINTKYEPDVGSMLGHRLRRWPNIDPTPGPYVTCLLGIGRSRNAERGSSWASVADDISTSRQHWFNEWLLLHTWPHVVTTFYCVIFWKRPHVNVGLLPRVVQNFKIMQKTNM